MNFLIIISIAVILFQFCYAPPVTPNKSKENPPQDVNGLEDYMEYHRYLKEVVSALESDPDFRKKLEEANETEIKSGRIADQLEFVSHHIRTQLDEIKRVELDRLRDLTEKKRRLMKNVDNEDPLHNHLDRSNPHTFEIEDLKKLIAKTTEDLAEADKKRKEEFKEYEMKKEYIKQDKLNHTNGDEREKLEHQIKEMEEKHKKHDKLHEPGHQAQLEEVWQEQDGMQQEFDPRTFFLLHDLDGNGLWDQDEVKSLFLKEINKMYQQGAPEDDMRERAEEMERMRETVFHEMDSNKDGFIDFEEFLAETKSNDFKEDHGWQGLDEQKPYTDEELQEYIRQHQANQIPQGYPDPNYHPQGYAVPPGGYQQQQFHPGQVPQNPPQALPGYHHPNEINSNSVPHGNYPQQGYQQPPNPQMHYQQNNPNPGNYPQHPNQPPQYQQNPPPLPQQQLNLNEVNPQQGAAPPQVNKAIPQQPAGGNLKPQPQVNAI